MKYFPTRGKWLEDANSKKIAYSITYNKISLNRGLPQCPRGKGGVYKNTDNHDNHWRHMQDALCEGCPRTTSRGFASSNRAARWDCRSCHDVALIRSDVPEPVRGTGSGSPRRDVADGIRNQHRRDNCG